MRRGRRRTPRKRRLRRDVEVRVLLDTVAVYRAAIGPAALSPAARAANEDPDTTLLVSLVSAWELTIKAARRKPSTLSNSETPRCKLVFAQRCDGVWFHVHPLGAVPMRRRR